jgi:hypothetical protein
MAALGYGGVEHHNGLYTVLKYITSYQCKGGKNTETWDNSMQTLTEEYCQNVDNGHKGIRSLIGKHMHELPKSMSVSRDQSQFVLAGGLLKRTTFGSIRRCSVSSEFLESFGDDDNSTSFVWKNVLKHYIARDGALHGISLYEFCCCHWPHDSKHKPVQFFGFNNQPSWPLDEVYSKWILTIYHPWIDNPDELKQPTYADFLSIHYMSSHIPSTVQSGISRSRHNIRGIDVRESSLDNAGAGASYTPTTDRVDERLNDIAAAEEVYQQHNFDYNDLHPEQFSLLPDPVPGSVKWSQSIGGDITCLNTHGSTWLMEKRTWFYDERDSIEHSSNAPVTLFQIDEFSPEHAKGKKQKMIIYLLLYQLYRYEISAASFLPTPPSIFLFAEGLPGTGKSRMLKTMRNIVRSVKRNNYAELTSAPTGVAASLIDATTHCRSCYLPTGKDFSKVPIQISATKSNSILHLKRHHQQLFLRAFDEHSMTGRKSFAWLKHRLEELRRPQETYDTAGNAIEISNHHPLPPDVYNRPFGGVPFVFSCGDHAQLPPVLDKVLHDKSPGKPLTADLCGKVAVSQFLNPDDNTQAESAVIILDEVLRQDDPVFLNFLSRMRDGALNMEDISLIRNRCLETMGLEDQEKFKNAIHLTSTWEEATKISFDYLCGLNVPLAKIRPKYSTSRNDGKNCCLKEVSYPSQLAIGIGVKVMLLKNFVVEEWHILNGSIGTVVDIIYEDDDGPIADGYPLPLFVVIDFPNSNIPEEHKCFPNRPRTHVAIPVVQERCQKKCCCITTIPIRVCIAITIYKSQGLTIGNGEQFERVVIHLPLDRRRVVPGLELVAFSHAKNLQCLAIGNRMEELVTDRLMKIGQSKGQQSYKDFMDLMKGKERETFEIYEGRIKDLVTNEIPDNRTFEGGCEYLLEWYHSRLH